MHLIFRRHEPRLVVVAFAVFCLLCSAAAVPPTTSSVNGVHRGTQMRWFGNSLKIGSVLIGQIRGRYSFGDRNRVKIETPFATFVYQMELSGDHMILREPNGSKLAFTRIR